MISLPSISSSLPSGISAMCRSIQESAESVFITPCDRLLLARELREIPAEEALGGPFAARALARLVPARVPPCLDRLADPPVLLARERPEFDEPLAIVIDALHRVAAQQPAHLHVGSPHVQRREAEGDDVIGARLHLEGIADP